MGMVEAAADIMEEAVAEAIMAVAAIASVAAEAITASAAVVR